jgi:hypothetical protein
MVTTRSGQTDTEQPAAADGAAVATDPPAATLQPIATAATGSGSSEHLQPSVQPSVQHSEHFQRSPDFAKHVKLRKFDGSGLLEDWLFKATELFSVLSPHWSEQQCVVWWGSNLTGSVETWYAWWRRLNPHAGVQQLLRDLRLEFASTVDSMRARDELHKLSMSADRLSASEYTRQFRTLVMRCSDVSEDEQIDKYIRGLTSSLARNVLLRRAMGELRTLPLVITAAAQFEHAERLAREHRESANKPAASPRFNRFRSGGRNGAAAEAGAGHVLAAAGGSSGPRRDAEPAHDRAKFYWHRASKTLVPMKNEKDETLCFCCLGYGHVKADCPRNRKPANR